MATILHIDTALEHAHTAIAVDGRLVSEKINTMQNQHAAFLQVAIEEMCVELNMTLNEVDAVGTTLGPGSYTGIRIGMASAKGICFALNKPLLAVSTLMAIAEVNKQLNPIYDLYVPMIDARRNDVFTAIYDNSRAVLSKPVSLTLSLQSFEKEIYGKKALFCGNAANKWQKIAGSKAHRYSFSGTSYDNHTLAGIFDKEFIAQNFKNLAYTEPIYAKEFHFG